MRRVILLLVLSPSLFAQQTLHRQLEGIARTAHGKVSVSCALPGVDLDCNLEPHSHPPMQSVFKLPLAIAMLRQIEQGRFKLDDPIRFRPEDRILPTVYSPLQDKYPDAGVDIPIRELLRLAVALSDNVAADMLLRIIAGPPAVTSYIASLGVTGFHLEDGEHELHRDVAAQYRNWFEPAGAVQLLRRIADHSPLTGEHTALLLSWMEASVQSGRLKAGVPPGTRVYHKAGTSDIDNGLAHATNDIALVGLPGGRLLAVAVFITDSTAGDADRDQIIAHIGRAIWDAASAH
jgi:beta-lactamase class A